MRICKWTFRDAIQTDDCGLIIRRLRIMIFLTFFNSDDSTETSSQTHTFTWCRRNRITWPSITCFHAFKKTRNFWNFRTQKAFRKLPSLWTTEHMFYFISIQSTTSVSTFTLILLPFLHHLKQNKFSRVTLECSLIKSSCRHAWLPLKKLTFCQIDRKKWRENVNETAIEAWY